MSRTCYVNLAGTDELIDFNRVKMMNSRRVRKGTGPRNRAGMTGLVTLTGGASHVRFHVTKGYHSCLAISASSISRYLNLYRGHGWRQENQKHQ